MLWKWCSPHISVGPKLILLTIYQHVVHKGLGEQLQVPSSTPIQYKSLQERYLLLLLFEECDCLPWCNCSAVYSLQSQPVLFHHSQCRAHWQLKYRKIQQWIVHTCTRIDHDSQNSRNITIRFCIILYSCILTDALQKIWTFPGMILFFYKVFHRLYESRFHFSRCLSNY